MSSHEIHHLLHLYGLALVVGAVGLQALGLPIPGGTALVAAAVYASTRHSLPLLGVLLAGAVGAFAGTACGFLLGRWRGEAVLIRFGRLVRQREDRIQRLRDDFAEHAALAVFIGRFITGVRNIVGLAAGASGMPVPRFLLANAVAATAWSTLITLEYYFFGHTFLGAATWLQVLLVVVGIAATVVSLALLRRGAQEAREAREARAEKAAASE